MLKIENVSKAFSSGKNILENINLEVGEHEFICLLGHSGCGKSTLLNIIAGLDSPTCGSVMLDGQPVSKPGTDRGYIFQEPALFPWLNVTDNVQFGMKMTGVPKPERQKKAAYYLDMVKLSDYGGYRVHELSGGMKQRVALARVLALDSKVLLMDEPFAALDSHTKSELRNHIVNIWRETKKTILFVTHSIEEAFALGTRVILFSSNPATIVKEYTALGKTPGDILKMTCEIEAALADGVTNIAS